MAFPKSCTTDSQNVCISLGPKQDLMSSDENDGDHLKTEESNSPTMFENDMDTISELSCLSVDSGSMKSYQQQVVVDINNEDNSPLHEGLMLEGSSVVRKRIRELVDGFTSRAHRVRLRLDFPPTPSPPNSPSPLNSAPKKDKGAEKEDEEHTEQKTAPIPAAASPSIEDTKWKFVFDPQGYVCIIWLFIVTTAYVYNCWVIPLRSTFPYQTPENRWTWITVDLICDIIFVLDLVAVQPRVKYIYDGLWIIDPVLTRHNYMKSLNFKIDIICLLPIDYIYMALKSNAVHAPFRALRLLKIHSFWSLFGQLDRVLASPHTVRITRTCVYMVYMIHVTACAYYGFSSWEGLGYNGWTYSGKGNAYIRCFYFATKTATSIGKNPKPENELEYLYMTAAWLMGVFIFALLIGQIRDIIATATQTQNDYRKLVDDTLNYLRRIHMPDELLRRVDSWFSYTWRTQRTLDENRIMDCFPHKIKTDIALSVHVDTLSKVSLFTDCDEGLLRELVLKLRAVIYLPGDLICRQGDVGKEMYIVKSGSVQVMGNHEDMVLATLKEGSVFGEISLLAIGSNRRTANVRSKGYSNLFVLSKSDLNEAIVHYPDAQAILRKKAQAIMARNAATSRFKLAKVEDPVIVIANTPSENTQPKLINTVMQAIPANSGAGTLLRYGSRKKVERFKNNQNQIKEENENFKISVNNLTNYPQYTLTISSLNDISHQQSLNRMNSLSNPNMSTEINTSKNDLKSFSSCNDKLLRSTDSSMITESISTDPKIKSYASCNEKLLTSIPKDNNKIQHDLLFSDKNSLGRKIISLDNLKTNNETIIQNHRISAKEYFSKIFHSSKYLNTNDKNHDHNSDIKTKLLSFDNKNKQVKDIKENFELTRPMKFSPEPTDKYKLASVYDEDSFKNSDTNKLDNQTNTYHNDISQTNTSSDAFVNRKQITKNNELILSSNKLLNQQPNITEFTAIQAAMNEVQKRILNFQNHNRITPTLHHQPVSNYRSYDNLAKRDEKNDNRNRSFHK